MRSILSVARAQLATALRERITLFWFLAFPLFLLTLLALIFSNVGTEVDEMTFDVTLVNLDRPVAGTADFSAGIVEVFRRLGEPRGEGQDPLFALHVPEQGADVPAYVESELAALRVGNRAAVVLIPEGFSASVARAALAPEENATSKLVVHTSAGRTSSDLVVSILDQVFVSVDREILTKLGLFDSSRALVLEERGVGSQGGGFRYVDFLLPGIVIMGFFTAGLFSVPGTILFGREQRILRAYWVTPLNVPRYFAGFALGHLGLCVLQFACVVLLGRFAFGARVDLLRPLPLLYLILAVVTFLALGFLVAALARTANAGMAIANIANMPMMFLGGLFFPIGELPVALRAVMLANPVTYLADGLRASTGTGAGVLPTAATIAVPVAWIALCIVVAVFRLRWDVER
ncbi:MAG: ABC transporter permease [Candidatus Bipolaricaulota bacterium]|nr:ABC transporter permease [Candidatus Bipolaricaulota bacterium]